MQSADDRIQNLIADECGECCEGDVEQRLDALEALEAAVPAEPGGDVALLEALGNDTRYRLARLLAGADGELCVCELHALVDVSESTISRGLSQLQEAGLVEKRKEGTWRYYRGTGTLQRILDALDGIREGER